VRIEALKRYATYLRRNDRREEAVACWRNWHGLDPDDPRPCLELAKHFEWQAVDLEQAQHWALEGLLCLNNWQAGWRRQQIWDEITHRLTRLAHKRGSQTMAPPPKA
jgi:hypothetical protein